MENSRRIYISHRTKRNDVRYAVTCKTYLQVCTQLRLQTVHAESVRKSPVVPQVPGASPVSFDRCSKVSRLVKIQDPILYKLPSPIKGCHQKEVNKINRRNSVAMNCKNTDSKNNFEQTTT